MSDIATLVSGASAFLAELRADQNRMVRCAADSDSVSNDSWPSSSSCFERGGQFGRLRRIITVVDQFSLEALQATIRPSGRGLRINGSTASIGTVESSDSAA